jgi:diketogulonate reductase-like aldo/keto reductase
MSTLNDTYTLNTGAKIPKIGFGTWQIPNGDDAYKSVLMALKNGYRHIDTARVYGNEESVGQAIKDSGVTRKDIFLTTKLPAEIKDYDGAIEAFETSLSKLGVEYVDLYLIHAPWPWSEQGADYTEGNIEVWKAMEEFYKSGRTKAIGVSNFNVSDIQAILDNGTVKPAANQIKFYIGSTQEEITQFCQSNDILIEAYSPLATGRILNNPEVQQLAEKYDKTVAQISLRYTLQRGTVTLPKSTHEEYIIQNADLDFELDAVDMTYLNDLQDIA